MTQVYPEAAVCPLYVNLPFYRATVFLTGRNFTTSHWPSPAKKWLWELTRRLSCADREYFWVQDWVQVEK